MRAGGGHQLPTGPPKFTGKGTLALNKGWWGLRVMSQPITTFASWAPSLPQGQVRRTVYSHPRPTDVFKSATEVRPRGDGNEMCSGPDRLLCSGLEHEGAGHASVPRGRERQSSDVSMASGD